MGLKEKWYNFAVGRLNVYPDFADAMWHLLETYYSFPASRSYHTLEWHIDYMLAEFHKFKEANPDYTEYWDEVEWAIWFHDIFYDLNAKYAQNELDSAVLGTILATYYTSLDRVIIEALIVCTTHDKHDLFDMVEMEQLPSAPIYLLCDLDLASFVAELPYFLESGDRLWQEYSNEVSNEIYVNNRSSFLSWLLSRNYIFLTEEFKKKDQLARERIKGIIDGKYDNREKC